MLASGFASGDLGVLQEHVRTSWDVFLAVATSADLQRPSRLPGWTGHDVCVHLGSWPEHRVVDALRESAAQGAGAEHHDADATNEALVARYAGAPDSDVLDALTRAREDAVTFLAGPGAAAEGGVLAGSPLGPLPVATILHAVCYELAVHALDLAPCGAMPPSPELLDHGLAALMDVTGALSSRHDVAITVTAQTPTGGWRFRSDAAGWETTPVAPGRFDGTGVRGTAADLLDTSAGRAHLGPLLLQRRLQVQQLPSFMRLAPLLHEVPGLPGGAALRAAVTGLGGVTRLLGRLRRS
jgi:uncharacterized protein (TIGR03083 family)